MVRNKLLQTVDELSHIPLPLFFWLSFRKEKFIEKIARHAVLARSKTDTELGGLENTPCATLGGSFVSCYKSEVVRLTCRSSLNKVSDLMRLTRPECVLYRRARLYLCNLCPTVLYLS